jgi:hypothetical protein
MKFLDKEGLTYLWGRISAALSKRPTVEEVAAMIDEKIAAHNRSEESHPTFLAVGEMEETNGAET